MGCFQSIFYINKKISFVIGSEFKVKKVKESSICNIGAKRMLIVRQ